MYTPNSQGYYQPYIPENGQIPNYQEYSYPYSPPPPAAETQLMKYSQHQQSYEMQDMRNQNLNSNNSYYQNQNYQNPKQNQQLVDEYSTPTQTGDNDSMYFSNKKGNSPYISYQNKQNKMLVDEYNTPTQRPDEDFMNLSYKNGKKKDTNIKKSSNFRQLENNNTQQVVVNVRSGVLKLQDLEGIYIKQKFDFAESVTGCDKANAYKVYPADCNGNKISNSYIFKCKEKSSFCSRNFLPGSRRPFNMVVKNKYGQISPNKESLQDSNFLLLRRPFKCTCLCMSRPELEVIITEQGINKLLGKILQPLYFCNIGLEIRDLQDNLKFIIEGNSCCMPAVWCRSLPCRTCQEAIFQIKDKNNQILSYITKKATSCLKSCASDTSHFSVTFPPNANPEDKVLIMSATLFLDYNYFEESNADKNSESSDIIYTQNNYNQNLNPLIIPLNKFKNP